MTSRSPSLELPAPIHEPTGSSGLLPSALTRLSLTEPALVRVASSFEVSHDNRGYRASVQSAVSLTIILSSTILECEPLDIMRRRIFEVKQAGEE